MKMENNKTAIKRYNVYSSDIGFVNWNGDEKGQWCKALEVETILASKDQELTALRLKVEELNEDVRAAGILTGEAAERFHERMLNPPVMSQEEYERIQASAARMEKILVKSPGTPEYKYEQLRLKANALAEALRSLKNNFVKGGSHTGDMYEVCEQALKDFEEGKVSSWVSVKERLPEFGESVLVYSKDETTIAKLYEWSGWSSYGMPVPGLTHWQPLPTAPQEGEQIK